MKTKIFTHLLLTATMSIIISSAAWAQVPSGYQCSIRNDSLLSSTVYEFDIYLLNTDLANVFEFDLFQAGIVVNASIINGGVITASILTGSSQLVPAQQPASITFNAAQHCIKLAPGGIVQHGASTTIISTTSPGTRVARIRLTNTVAFGQFSPNAFFNFTASPYNTVVTAYNQTTPYLGVNITNASNHTVATMTNPFLNAPVTAYNMTGGGNYCFGEPGAEVGLSGSEVGVKYILEKNTSPTGSYIPGTGAALSFGLQTTGSYTSSAYRKATYLTGIMNGSVNVTVTTVTPTLAGLVSVCEGTAGVVYTTEAGKDNYVWSVSAGGNITSGGTSADNTATISWSIAGAQSVSVNYSVLGCTAASPAIYPVTVDSRPNPTITGSDFVCTSSTGIVYTTQPGMSNYAWTVSTGGTIDAGGGSADNTITIIWNTAGAQYVEVNYTSGNCSAVNPTNYPVTVGGSYSPSLSGINTPCVGATNVVYTTEAGMTNYAWIVSSGGTVTAGGTSTSNTVTVTWNTAGAETVSVNYDNGTCTSLGAKVYNVSVQDNVGTPTAITIASGTEPACQLTNGTTTTTYATTAANSTGFNWSVSNGAAGTINPTTGLMTWTNGFSGSVDIQVTANGCYGPSPQVTRTVIITPTVGTPTAITISAGTEPTCQLTNGTTTTTYATTATNNTGLNWSVSNGAAGSIGATTGLMTWTNGFAGSVDIQVTADGCNGPSAQTVRTVNVTPTVGTPTAITVSAGTEPACQMTNGTTTTTYATTATDNTGFNWTISNALAGSIDPSTGVMTWANGFFGSVDIQVTANGCYGPSAQVTRTVNLSPTVGTPTAITISAGSDPVCQLTNGTTTTTYSTTAANSTGFNWSLSNGAAGSIGATTGLMTWSNGFSGSVNIQVTANGCNGPSAQTVRTVNVTPTVGTPTAITISSGTEPTCQLTNGTTTTTYSTTASDNTGLNWSISNGAAGSIGAATGIMTWTNGFSGSVDIQVTANGCNGPSAQTVRTVVVTPTVGAPTPITIAAGFQPTCQLTNGTTTTTYATTATNSAGFSWSISNSLAGSIDPSTGVMTWANGFFGVVNIQVQALGCNGPSTMIARAVNITRTVGTPTAITISAGTEPTCQLTNGTTTTTYATTATSNTGFNWSLSNGAAGSIGATTGIMTWTNGFSGSVDIQVTANGCNGPSAQTVRTVNVTPTVGTPTAITIASGTEPTCQLTNGTTTTTYATTATDNTGFNWSVSNGAAGSIGATTGIMTWTNGFSGSVDIQVTADGCNGPSAQTFRTVVLAPTVGTPTAITISAGTEPTCQLTNGTTTTTYATTATNNTGFNWSVSNGAAGSIGATTGLMTWTNGFSGSVDIQVTANGCNGPSSQVFRTVNITPTVGTPTVITISAGTEPTCQLTNGTTTTTYATTATNNTGFNWSLSNGAAGSIGATTGIMTWTNGFSGSVDIQVTANGCNGPSAQTFRTVVVTPTVGTPTAITISAGTEPTCQLTNGTTTTTYATTATNNTGFNWSVSNGAAGSIGATTGIMTWTNGFSGSVDIQVTANGCNGPSAQTFRTVVLAPTVGTPTGITISAGTEPTCQLTNGTTTTTYATTATDNTGFNWSVSNGAAGSIGATTGVMTWADGFSGTVNIQVTASGCNGPSAQVSRTVTITPTVGTPTAITISAGTEPSCQLTNGTTTTTYATTATDNTGFNWSVSNSAAGTIGATTGIMTWTNGFSGSVNIQVSANGCNGPSAQTIRTVTITPTVGTPTAITISAGTEPACQLTNGTTTTTYATTASNSTGFNWSVSNSAAGTIGATTGIMTWTNGFSGSVDIQVTANGCNGPSAQTVRTVIVATRLTVSVSIAADANPVCAGTTVNFTATPTNGGLTPSYAWYVNNVQDVLASGSTYSYIPLTGDQVKVVLISSEPCTTGNPLSNAVTMTVNPVATPDFVADNLNPATNSVVIFTDLSTGTATSWSWSFNPATVTYEPGSNANSRNPQVKFNAGGPYSVTLTVNEATCPNAVTKTDYIYVGTAGLWTGLTSSDWSAATNWDNHLVPSNLIDVVIPASAPFWPTYTGTITLGTTCKSITLIGVTSQLTITGDLIILNGYTVNNEGNIRLLAH